jgi:hypothetical protein
LAARQMRARDHRKPSRLGLAHRRQSHRWRLLMKRREL